MEHLACGRPGAAATKQRENETISDRRSVTMSVTGLDRLGSNKKRSSSGADVVALLQGRSPGYVGIQSLPVRQAPLQLGVGQADLWQKDLEEEVNVRSFGISPKGASADVGTGSLLEVAICTGLHRQLNANAKRGIFAAKAIWRRNGSNSRHRQADQSTNRNEMARDPVAELMHHDRRGRPT
jgi:hypothetical protein